MNKAVYVQCPFYQKDDGKRNIRCEGVMDGSVLILRFQEAEDFNRQMKVFCCDHYKKCEVYRAAMEKYDDCW